MSRRKEPLKYEILKYLVKNRIMTKYDYVTKNKLKKDIELKSDTSLSNHYYRCLRQLKRLGLIVFEPSGGEDLVFLNPDRIEVALFISTQGDTLMNVFSMKSITLDGKPAKVKIKPNDLDKAVKFLVDTPPEIIGKLVELYNSKKLSKG
jgi:hypothetical protein